MLSKKLFQSLLDASGYLSQSRKELDAEAVEFINNLFAAQGSLENEPFMSDGILGFPNITFIPKGLMCPFVAKICGMAFNHETNETDVKVVYVLDGNRIDFRWVPISEILNPCKVLEYIRIGIAQGLIEC